MAEGLARKIKGFAKNRYLLAVAFLIIGFTAGGGAGALAYQHFNPPPPNLYELNNQYPLVSPVLYCGSDSNLNGQQAVDLQTQLKNAIQVGKDSGSVVTAAIYFKDLNNGPWVGIDEDQTFDPGSLLKIPLAIALYKQAESDPSFLEQEFDYTGTETDDSQFFKPHPLSPGKYTVQQLVSQMLIYSDNNAANVLANAIGVSGFESTYLQLGIATPPTEGTDYTITPHSYAEFFRVLYSATYLDANDSEHILELLTQSTFKDGLVAGVPSSVQVAHKFGERSYTDSSLLELHDCGIVYAPGHPYILCVMTEGYDYPTLAKFIAQISNITYNYVE